MLYYVIGAVFGFIAYIIYCRVSASLEKKRAEKAIRTAGKNANNNKSERSDRGDDIV